MTEDIKLNIDAICNHYHKYGLDKKVRILIHSILLKLSKPIDDSSLCVLESILINELNKSNKIDLFVLINTLSSFNSFKTYIKNINIYDSSIKFLKQDELRQKDVYNNIKKSNLLESLKLIKLEENTFIKNDILENKLKELDKDMEVLIKQYNQNRQVDKNIYYDINNKKIQIKVNSFFRLIKNNTLKHFGNKLVLGFTNTYDNNHGFLFVEDYGKTSSSEYETWCEELKKYYQSKDNINILKIDDLNNSFGLYYKQESNNNYIYIKTKYNLYNEHIYKLIKTSTSDFYGEENWDYDIESFKVEEELNYQPIKEIHSDLIGEITYQIDKHIYHGNINNIIFSLYTSMNNRIKDMIKKAENIYNNLEIIIQGIWKKINLSFKPSIKAIDVYEDYYILKLHNKTNNQEISIQIDTEGNVILNNVNM